MDASSQKKTGEKLNDEINESEHSFRALFNSIEQGFCVVEVFFDENLSPIDYRFLEVNALFELMTGIQNAEALSGKTARQLVPNLEDKWVEIYGSVALTGESVRFTDGSEAMNRWFEVSASRIGGETSRKVALIFNDVTEKKRSEKALQESEIRYRTLVEQASDGIHTYDLQGNFIDTNSKLCEMLGYTRDELLNLNVKDLVPAEDLTADPIQFDELRAGETLLRERRILRKDGTLLPVEISGRMVRDGVLQAIIRDITDRKRAEESLRNSEKQMRLITDSIPLLVSYVDDHHRYRFVNRSYSEWFGKSNEEIVGKHLSEVLGDEAYASILPEVEKALAGEEVVFERSVPYKSGERFIHVNYIPDFDAATGQVKGFNSFVQDISEKKRADEALRKNEEWLRSIFETSRDGILVEDEEKIVYVNKSYTRLFGYDEPEELIGKHVSVVISPGEIERMLDYGRKRLQGERPDAIYEFKGQNKNGTLIDLEASVTSLNVGGRSYITTMIRDIAERKKSEKILRESKDLLQGTIDALTGNIAVLDKNGIIIKVNAAWRDFADENSFADGNYGIGLNYLEASAPEEKFDSGAGDLFGRAAAEGIINVINGQDSLFELEYPCYGTKETKWFLMRVTSFGTGENLRVVVAHENITDRKQALLELEQAEEQLRRSHVRLEQRVQERTAELKKANEKLQAEIIERRQAEKERVQVLQQLVSVQEDERRRIARDLHDQLGQQLTILRLKLESLQKVCAAVENLSEQVNEIRQIGRRIDSDVDFLAWQMRPTALDDLGIVAALDQYVRQWSAHFDIPAEFNANRFGKIDLSPEAETHFYRIAQEALNNIGKHAKATAVFVSLEPRADDTILIIEDDGVGFKIDDKIQQRKGTKGKGLVGMRERAALVGGTLEIESAKGKGTTVYVRVPTNGDRSSNE